MPTAAQSGNIFVAIATDSPPAQITSRGYHPVARLGILNQTQPIETNKFYANFFLGTQSSPTWTHPYSVAWSKGGGSVGSWGMSISHFESSAFYFGSTPSYTNNTFPDTQAVEYYGMLSF